MITYPAGVTRSAHTLDVHIASWKPERWDEVENIRSNANPSAWRGKRRPSIATERINWAALQITPRWLGDDSSEAVAGLEPSIFHDGGGREWDRLISGGASRGEIVLAVSTVGSDQEPEYAPLGGPAASVWLPGAPMTTVGGAQIALASRPEPAAGLGRADRDLALRIANTRPRDLPWWQLAMRGVETERGFDRPEEHEPEGTLRRSW